MKGKKSETIDLEKLQQEINSWATSPEGQEAIQTSVKNAEDVTRKLREARLVSPDLIHKPFTV